MPTKDSNVVVARERSHANSFDEVNGLQASFGQGLGVGSRGGCDLGANVPYAVSDMDDIASTFPNVRLEPEAR